MPLTLRVSSRHREAMGASAAHVFHRGGTIGRTPEDNDWALPDPTKHVSREHVVISVEADAYFLTDCSTNGTIVNDRELKGARTRLNVGDCLVIGDYEISVESADVASAAHVPASGGKASSAPSASAPAADSFFADLGPSSHGATASLPNSAGNSPMDVAIDPRAGAAAAASAAGSDGTSEVEVPPKDWFKDILDDESPPPSPAQAEPPQAAPPQSTPASLLEPEPIEPRPAHISPTAAPSTAPPPGPQTAAQSADLDTLLSAAGIDPRSVDSSTLVSLGEILRVAVEGVVELLRARTQMKNSLRVAMTTVKLSENNPLKMSANAEDALFNLFGKRNKSFQEPTAAFREAFDDLKAHQYAMTAGVRAGFDSMLRQFDPDDLQENFDRGMKRSALLDVINKTKYWDLYREWFSEFGSDDKTYRELFGDDFADAYEHYMQSRPMQRDS